MKDQYLANGVKVKFTKEYPGEPSVYNTHRGCSLENEIEWAEFELKLAEQRLDLLYKQRRWWKRFMEYCNTPCCRFKVTK